MVCGRRSIAQRSISMNCSFQIEGEGQRCQRCGFFARVPADRNLVRACSKCPYLGDPIERDGVAITVKCNCGKKKEKNMFLPTFRCDIFRRCVPTANMTDKQLAKWAERDESRMYGLCQLCPIPETKVQYLDEPR